MNQDSREKQQSDIRVTKLELEIDRVIADKGKGCSHIEILSALQNQLSHWVAQSRKKEIEDAEAHISLERSVEGHFYLKDSSILCQSPEHRLIGASPATKCWKAEYNTFMRDTL